MALTQGRFLSFLLDHGGKVKNSELLSNFKEFINITDPLEKGRNRDLFKSFVNTVAVVKQIGDEKYVVVKKKYTELVKGESDPVETETEHCPTSLNYSVETAGAAERSGFSTSESDTIYNADDLNNNYSFRTSPNSVCCISNSEILPANPDFRVNSFADNNPRIPPPGTWTRSRSGDFLAVLNISNNTKVAKQGAVFAVVTINPRSQCEHPCRNSAKCHRKTGPEESAAAQRLRCSGSRTQRVLTERTGAAENNWSDRSEDGAGYELHGSVRAQRSGSVAPVYPAEPSLDLMPPAAFRLEPSEHEWLVKCAAGHWAHVNRLLAQDVRLTEKRSFVSGFTALHWAAKNGNSKMVSKILLVSQQDTVNTKSYDGYTALHIAAIHNHASVLNVLVRDYGANRNIRDNSGKKPYQYLRKDVSPAVRELLGDPRDLHMPGEHTRMDQDQHFQDLPKGFSTLGKFFQSRQRKKLRRKTSVHFVSLDQAED